MYRIMWWLSVSAIVTAIGIGYLVLPRLPEQLPSHWNSAGAVDGWQSGLTYFWFMPAVTLVFVAVLGIMSARMTDARVRPYIAMSAGLFTAYLLGLHALIGVRSVAGQAIAMAEFMRLMGGLFIGLACIIKTVPPNHVVGFRFPWTLRDADTWAHTHAIGFWGMAIGGVICVMVAFLPVANEYMFGLGIGAIVIGITIPSVYSYWYWRIKQSS